MGKKMPLKNFTDIDTPSLIINMDVVEKNLGRMQEKAQKYGVSLRPHIKAHKIPELAQLQLQKGAVGITASKVSEAETMAAAGIKDIFIANQIVTPPKIERLIALSKNADVSVGLDSRDGAEMLSQIAQANNVVLDYLIEINCGLNRCGVLPGKPAFELYEAIQDFQSITFKGIFTHAGQAYAAPSIEDIQKISRHESDVMAQTASGFQEMNVPPGIVSVGSTPTMKVWEGHPAINEIRPGNYIFHDAMQMAMGTAGPEECSLSMLAAVISRPDPCRAVIDAGSKVLGLDKGGHGFESVKGFGMIKGKNAVLERLSEEHGIISLPADEHMDVGDQLEIIPNHACPVINLFDKAYFMRNGEIRGEFNIAARGKVK